MYTNLLNDFFAAASDGIVPFFNDFLALRVNDSNHHSIKRHAKPLQRHSLKKSIFQWMMILFEGCAICSTTKF